MALSFANYTGDGSNKNFAVPFGYITQSNVTVLVNNVSVPFTWLNGSLVQATTAPATGASVQVRRTTQKAQPLVDFQDASTLTESDLDLFSQQMLYIAQEAFDGQSTMVGPDDTTDQMNAHNKRIINLADPINPQDAATKNWMETASTSTLAQTIIARDEAEAHQLAAEVARDQAEAAAAAGVSSVIGTKAIAAAMNPTVSPDAVYLAGHLSPGDGGGGLFKKVVSQPTHTAKFQMANGQWYEFSGNVLNVKAFGALATFDPGTGLGADDSAAIQSALDVHKVTGKPVYIPVGNYKANNLQYILTTGANGFREGFRLFGDGAERTKIYGTASGTTLKVEADASKYFLGGWIKGLSFSSYGRAATYGIFLHRCFHMTLSDIYIVGYSQDGIQIPTLYGDADPLNDGANNIVLDQVRILFCDAWGINNPVGTGVNENSFLTLRNSTIEQCGNATTTVGGGMFWRGQMLLMQHTSFVLNNNRGLYIEGGAGVGQNVAGDNVTFENNAGKHIECWGIRQMVFDNLQIYCSPSYTSTHGIYLNGTATLIENVHIRSCRVRVDQTTPFVAFHTQGANIVNCKVENVVWAVFNGLGGQVKYDGDWIVVPQIKPSVVARVAAAQSVFATDTTILFDTKDFDPAVAFNVATGVYTAPVTGVYLVSAMLTPTAVAAGGVGTIKIYDVDLAAEIARVTKKFVGAGDDSMSIDRLVYLPAGRRILIRATTDATRSLSLGGSNQNNYLTVSLQPQ
jgi:hypothetical protein